MPLTLQEYDERVGRHLSAIRYYAARVEQHAHDMTRKANFEMMAEDELLKCHDVLIGAAAQVRRALETIREKPTDA